MALVCVTEGFKVCACTNHIYHGTVSQIIIPINLQHRVQSFSILGSDPIFLVLHCLQQPVSFLEVFLYQPLVHLFQVIKAGFVYRSLCYCIDGKSIRLISVKKTLYTNYSKLQGLPLSGGNYDHDICTLSEAQYVCSHQKLSSAYQVIFIAPFYLYSCAIRPIKFS